jgi:hypothetical protein
LHVKLINHKLLQLLDGHGLDTRALALLLQKLLKRQLDDLQLALNLLLK